VKLYPKKVKGKRKLASRQDLANLKHLKVIRYGKGSKSG
jgi:hypothetical protein